MTVNLEKFEKAVKVVLDHERGYSDNPKDPGGATKWGISLRYLLESKNDINHDGKIDAEDIRGLKVEQAKQIYLHDWWMRYKYDQITSTLVATKTLDLSVNMGGDAAHKVIQRAINMLSINPIKEDGIIGSKTLHYLNSLNVKDLMEEICAEAEAKYKRVVAKNPNLNWALHGFLNRAAWGCD